MNYPMICQILARVTFIEAGLFLLPMGVAIFYGTPFDGFVIASVVALLTSLLFYRVRPEHTTFSVREGFGSVTLAWIVLSLIGAIPFVVIGHLTFIDAFFETIAGFTTTSSSILVDGVESLDRGLLFWRCFTHWIGGMGVLIFMMAVLPMAEKHSMHILRAELPGPVARKLVPHMRQTSILLYTIYISLTLLEFFLLKIGGLSSFDAIVHAFGTASTGGCSSYNASVAYFDSVYVEIVIGIFMILFGANLQIYYLLLLRKIKPVLCNEELRWYLGILLVGTVIMTLNLQQVYHNLPTALRYGFFQTVASLTTTTYTAADYTLWPQFCQWFLFFLMFCGACAGSTGSGVKLARIIILTKAAWSQVRHMLRPHSFEQIRLNNTVIDRDIIQLTLIYLYFYFFIGTFICICLALEGFDFATTATTALSCLSNIGMGASVIGPYGGFADFSTPGKLLLAFGMLLGRLEIYPVLLTIAAFVTRKK